MQRRHRLIAPARRAVACLTALTLATLTLAGSGCTYTPNPPPPAIDEGTYRIGPPDVLRIKILPDPPIEVEETVRPDGMISVDLIGDVLAQKRTTNEVAEEIEVRIGRFKRNAKVTVALAVAASPTVTIFGQVGSPGVFPLNRETRVAEAIGIQGGTTIFASKGSVRVVRTDGIETEVHQIDLSAIQRGDLTTNMVLMQGDMVVVPPNAFARVGFLLQSILLPFTQLSGTAGMVWGFAR